MYINNLVSIFFCSYLEEHEVHKKYSEIIDKSGNFILDTRE